ncbi:uncharacterized protein LOC129582726 [Paramacrobiotus metropolitanus]|uniref:uncharacterized protein LOC129582726 n=1 Tax=Paramacrobiotus metropolitanus TaxID=2943436 RepID=UPI00244630C1|nr:uncharacterized protein LOC129582726 [Paramacrobiotus metropolitanus]
MYLYENDERSVYAWNSVDVEINGLLQHGHVIGLEEKSEGDSTPPRVIVDFGCPSQQSVAVGFGKIWDCSTEPYSIPCKGDKVEVLLQDGPHRPWAWYSGKVLIRKFKHLQHVALVDVMIGGAWRRELIPDRQIRDLTVRVLRAPPLATDHFVMRTCSVPHGYWILDRKPAAFMLRLMEKRFQLRFVKILSQTMLYLRRLRESPLGEGHRFDDHPVKIFEREWKRTTFSPEWREEAERADAEPKRKQPLRVGEDGLAVPLGVLKEIFHSLDTVDRQRCRRTCRLWETQLTSAELCEIVRVSRQKESSSRPVQFDCNYAMYACIFKHITPAVHTVCIRDTETFFLTRYTMQDDTDEVLDIIKKLLDDAGRRLERLIVHRRSVRLGESAFEHWKLGVFATEITAQKARLGACCDRLIFKDYALATESKGGATMMEFRVPIVVIPEGPVDEAQIVDTFEKHLQWNVPPLDVDSFAQCMAGLIDSKERAKKVLKILEDYQSCDPRPSAHYRGCRWSADDLTDMDMGKLNRFCLYALARYTKDLGEAPGEDAGQSGDFKNGTCESSSDSDENDDSDE